MSSSEEEEVRSLLMRHRLQMIREFNEVKLLPVLIKNNVINEIEEKIIQCAINFNTTTINNSDKSSDDYDIEKKCLIIIDIVAKNGFQKFKEFCYAIENVCPQLIEDLINDRLNYGMIFFFFI